MVIIGEDTPSVSVVVFKFIHVMFPLMVIDLIAKL